MIRQVSKRMADVEETQADLEISQVLLELHLACPVVKTYSFLKTEKRSDK